jgi:pyruvate kinase
MSVHRPGSMPTPLPADAQLRGIARQLQRLLQSAKVLEAEMKGRLELVPDEQRESARNLVHYIALRQADLRDLQRQLQQRGLSSLGRSEGCVLASLLEVSMRAQEALALRGDRTAVAELQALGQERADALSFEAARDLLHRNTRSVLGPRPDDRHTYIMVTAPSAREADRAWMARMIRAGMNVLRINCAHEGPSEWEAMATALRQAEREVGRECRILADLAGPKMRTGRVKGGRHIATWKPVKDDIGRVVTPAQVPIYPARPGNSRPESALFVAEGMFHRLKSGDELRFRDARGRGRVLVVRTVNDEVAVTQASRRAYVLETARVRLVPKKGKKGRPHEGVLQVLGEPQSYIEVRAGDTLQLTARPVDGRGPRRDGAGGVVRPGVISCTLPAALKNLSEGHRVLFDDGRIEAVVQRVEAPGEALLHVTRTHKQTTKLRGEKGINLPDTDIDVAGLSKDDTDALRFAASHADAVGLSFVRRARDVRELHERLGRLRQRTIGIVLKIETRAGFENLPEVLLESLVRPPVAVMIARGDLAVEVGFERLAELQEEILWLCEACHVPSIWATQVLDTLARTGVPSRAEVTDAAAGVAAECVMLNKGPFVEEAVRVLSDILRRMEKHHYKKRSLYRRLRVAFGPFDSRRALQEQPLRH